MRPTPASSTATSPARGCRCIRTRTSWTISAPIVSVSLGLPATFLFGGLARSDKPRRFRLVHGDVVVWGGPSRLAYHGVAPLADGEHALLGGKRINLTFRRTR
ncbi:alkylated DNA repair dioxygenase AlkB [Bradyrhizobium japonicum]